MLVHEQRAYDWQTFLLPGGDRPVEMVTLDHDPATRARTVLVRFPPGWHRLEQGSYVAAEDVVLLEGNLESNGSTWHAGDWAYIPAYGLRVDMKTREGALAYARFLGPPKWLPGEGNGVPFEHRRLDDIANGAPSPSPVGAQGWLLRRADDVQTWLLPAVGTAVARERIEVFGLASHVYAFAEPGETLPAISERTICRTFGGDA